jgi:hypothetical protein
MSSLLNEPVVLFGAAFFALALSAQAGTLLQKTLGELRQEDREDFAFVLTATLCGHCRSELGSGRNVTGDAAYGNHRAERNNLGGDCARPDLEWHRKQRVRCSNAVENCHN